MRVNEHFRKCTRIFVPLYSWAFKNPIVQKICQKKFLNLIRFFSNTVVPVIYDRSLLAGFWWAWASKFWPKEPCRLHEVHAQILGFRQWNIFGLVSISKLLPLNSVKWNIPPFWFSNCKKTQLGRNMQEISLVTCCKIFMCIEHNQNKIKMYVSNHDLFLAI